MSKLFAWRIYFLLLTLPLTGHAAGLIPIKDFARKPEVSDLQVSPDGKTIGYIVGLEDGAALCFRDLATGKVVIVDPQTPTFAYGPHASDAGKEEIVGFYWFSDKSVVFTATSWDSYLSGQSSVNCDGTFLFPGFMVAQVNSSGQSAVYDGDILWQEMSGTDHGRDWAGFTGMMSHGFESKSGSIYTLRYDSDDKPSVFQTDAHNGMSSLMALNPGNVGSWEVDHQDQLRIGIISNGVRIQVIYRGDNRAPWQQLPDFDSAGLGYYPLGFGYDDHTLYVAAKTHTGTWGLYPYDVITLKLGPVLCESPDYDIVSPHYNPDGVGLIFSHMKHRLIGVRYVADWLHMVWFDREMAGYQATLDRALPRTINVISSFSDDETKLVVHSYSDRNPGVYYLFTPEKQTLDEIAVCRPWVDSTKMGETLPITYHARDGLPIHAYLTLPPGTSGKHLPLVVYPHDGPFMRDTLKFDPFVQFLASRGYAVLQVNYRGSPGYGETFYRAGWKGMGRAIQDDITDGVKAVVAGGVADPKRIAIFGEGYGGYAALGALENTPGLYCCGISFAGVTDWNSILTEHHEAIRLGEAGSEADEAHDYWKQKLGSLATDEASLEAISPLYHVGRIKAPVFLIQGTADRIVPDSQAKRFISALKENNRPYESWFVHGEGHGWLHPENRAELYKRIEAFLAKNMK